MTKALNTLIFLFFGLISIYVSLRLLEFLDLHAIFPDRVRKGCWEIDHCRIPFWYWCVLGSLLTLPLLFFSYCGFSLRAGRFFKLDTVKKMAAHFSATLIFLGVGDVVFFFMKTM